MRKMLSPCPALALALLASASTSAAPSRGPVYTPYAISASTAEELIAQMSRLGPPQQDGRRFPGGASWRLNWQYSTTQHGSRCRIGQLRVNLETTITLPQWQQRDQADPELGAEWDAFLAQLDVHEQGHVQHGMEAAEEVRHALNGMSGSCSALAEQANQRGTQIVEQYNQRDRDYDQQTRHGRTQGAVLQH